VRSRTEYLRAWRAANSEKVKAAKRKYYSSEKGKAQKRKEDAAYAASGGRAAYEKRRSAKPISEARKQARLRYQLVRRSFEKNLSEFDRLVLTEAVDLMRKRSAITGFSWHVDHIIPVSKGGTSSANNLQVVPALWNRKKSNAHTERFFGALNKEQL
jgi:hypothetical protein